jgi:N-methylhydantoinase B/oxoprolinase/acetone carboxylase alpha subunit
MARSRVNSDRQGFIEAGIAKATFYTWPAEERERLNNLAQQFKRETATRALIVLQDAAEEAAKVKVSGLKSRDERVKQAAATEIIDRTIGKTEQPVSGEVNIVVTLKENDRVQNTD